jgi:hypothetical protein
LNRKEGWDLQVRLADRSEERNAQLEIDRASGKVGVEGVSLCYRIQKRTHGVKNELGAASGVGTENLAQIIVMAEAILSLSSKSRSEFQPRSLPSDSRPSYRLMSSFVGPAYYQRQLLLCRMRSLHRYYRYYQKDCVAFSPSTCLLTSVNLPHPKARYHDDPQRPLSISTIVTVHELPPPLLTYDHLEGFDIFCFGS